MYLLGAFGHPRLRSAVFLVRSPVGRRIIGRPVVRRRASGASVRSVALGCSSVPLASGVVGAATDGAGVPAGPPPRRTAVRSDGGAVAVPLLGAVAVHGVFAAILLLLGRRVRHPPAAPAGWLRGRHSRCVLAPTS